MPPVHSRRTRAHLNRFPLACQVRTVGVDLNVDMTDVTTLCEDAYVYVEGHEAGTFSFGGFVDNDPTVLFTPLEDLRQVGTDSVVTVAPTGYAIGEAVWSAAAKVNSLNHETTLTGAAAFTVGLTTEGRPDMGVSLHNVLAAETTAGSSASVDNAAATSNGGAAVVHCSAFTGTNITIRVQHSVDNSTWADLVTFTALTGAGSQRVEVAAGTTVRRYLRSNWTGTFTSATFAVAFARR